MTRSAPGAADWNTNVNALLVIASTPLIAWDQPHIQFRTTVLHENPEQEPRPTAAVDELSFPMLTNLSHVPCIRNGAKDSFCIVSSNRRTLNLEFLIFHHQTGRQSGNQGQALPVFPHE
jgi:hypothetical protein